MNHPPQYILSTLTIISLSALSSATWADSAIEVDFNEFREASLSGQHGWRIQVGSSPTIVYEEELDRKALVGSSENSRSIKDYLPFPGLEVDRSYRLEFTASVEGTDLHDRQNQVMVGLGTTEVNAPAHFAITPLSFFVREVGFGDIQRAYMASGELARPRSGHIYSIRVVMDPASGTATMEIRDDTLQEERFTPLYNGSTDMNRQFSLGGEAADFVHWNRVWVRLGSGDSNRLYHILFQED